ncbi:MAG: hypothetical protein UY65_C0024G0009, partial [Parcubacteria group bacterium GW2011_GWA2_51_12]
AEFPLLMVRLNLHRAVAVFFRCPKRRDFAARGLEDRDRDDSAVGREHLGHIQFASEDKFHPVRYLSNTLNVDNWTIHPADLRIKEDYLTG